MAWQHPVIAKGCDRSRSGAHSTSSVPVSQERLSAILQLPVSEARQIHAKTIDGAEADYADREADGFEKDSTAGERYSRCLRTSLMASRPLSGTAFGLRNRKPNRNHSCSRFSVATIGSRSAALTCGGASSVA